MERRVRKKEGRRKTHDARAAAGKPRRRHSKDDARMQMSWQTMPGCDGGESAASTEGREW